MEEPASKKKRTRASESADGDDKKRGRPRVEKQDESAADVGTPNFCSSSYDQKSFESRRMEWNVLLGLRSSGRAHGDESGRSTQVHAGWEGWGHCTTVVLEIVETA
jgi:hypothetical protein